MKLLNLIILENTSSELLLQQLKGLNLSHIDVHLVWLKNDDQSYDNLQAFVENLNFQLEMIKNEEEEFLFKDVLKNVESEFICFFNPTLNYPEDYFKNTILRKEEDDDQPSVRKGSFSERVLRAAQQSKYGLGVLKKDIKRDFPELTLSEIYHLTDLKTGHIMELSVSEDLAKEVRVWAKKSNIESISYHPDYKKIEYFDQLSEYISQIKKEAPYLTFKTNKDASGLPLYLLIILWLSFISIFIFPAGILAFLIMLAIYALTISLESLAISTIKRQGEIFVGLLFFFPFLHHVYLFSYFSSLITGKKSI